MRIVRLVNVQEAQFVTVPRLGVYCNIMFSSFWEII